MSISFNIDSGVFSNVLERLAVKGKHNNGSVLSTSSFNTEFLARFENDTMTIINGDSIWFGQIKIPIANLVCNDDNEFSAEADRLLPFLKSLSGLLSVNIDNHITISNGTKSFSLPKLHLHPHIDAINRIVAMTKAYAYEETLQNLFGFGDTKFEGAFKMSKGDFEGIIKSAELIKTGVYTLNLHEGNVTFSSSALDNLSYKETVSLENYIGESATLQFSSPLYSFFDKEQMLNFYVKDDSPIIIIAEDRFILKAPHVVGDDY